MTAWSEAEGQPLPSAKEATHSKRTSGSSALASLEKVLAHLVRKFKGQTPGTSSRSSRPSFDKDKEEVKTEIEQASTSCADAKEVKDYSTSVLAVLQQFGYDASKINGSNTTRDMRFRPFEVLVRNDHTSRGNRGITSIALNSLLHPVCSMPEQVIFRSAGPDNLPLPSPELLSVHAACSKIAHLSGAAEHVDKLNQEAEAPPCWQPTVDKHVLFIL
ncbi:hypothetical protein BDP27DRAFT_1408102 [Rhodocollybia butyracea]|uniref:Uncharacterized protein n=1 Tax=Rhodocollybia butyracea TaxID=206335 RepID=A0A9P5TY07_9AGAR|nr:hypothetical protein BDP27DRAFT_1408102 [Rhodocollybia butyracea]